MAAETLVPTSADEAAQLFGDGEGITVFAGGTILMPEIAAGRLKPARALLLHRSGLDGSSTDGDVVRIGAMTPGRGARRRERRAARPLRRARSRDLEVRAAATVGGNLCAPRGPRRRSAATSARR